MADNPFNALLDPSRGGSIGGLIGSIMGNPTAQQAAGQATGQALKALSDLRAQGVPPQQALVQFLQTPEGVDYFTNAGKDGLSNLTEALTATVPPKPVQHTLAPGAQLYTTDANGRPVLSASNPTSEQQNFAVFSNIAQLPPDKVRELAQAQIDKSKDPSEKVVALQNLVKNYGMDPAVAQGIIAGSIKVLPVKDQYGQDTGNVSIVNLGTNTNQVLKPGQSVNVGPNGQPTSPDAAGTTTPSQPAGPGVTPAEGAGTGVLPPTKGASTVDPTANKEYFGDKASMFLGAGIVPSILGTASKLGEQVSPDLILPEGAKANDRKTLIANVTNALLSLSDQNGGFGVNRSIVQSYKDLLPTDSITESPHSAIQKGIRLLQKVQGEISAEEKKTTDRSLPQTERVAAARRAEGWKRVERTLPTMQEMSNMESAIRNGTAGAQNVEQGVKELTNQGERVLTSGKKQAAQVQSDVTGPDIAHMSEPQLLTLDPRKLTLQQMTALRNRIRELKANGAKSR